MRYRFVILLFLSLPFFAIAQKKKLPPIIFTNLSSTYFSLGEVDSTLYVNSWKIFNDNGIPRRLFDSKYDDVKVLLLNAIRPGVSASFKTIDNKIKKTGSNKSTDILPENKKLYTDALREHIRLAFANNYNLKKYLSAGNADRITYYNSIVKVNTDGTLTVTENITVNNGNGSINPIYGMDEELREAGFFNDDIKRGIVRAFPLYYVNEHSKLFQNTTFKIKEVLRDGKKENYHTEKKENGILIYFGQSSVYINPGMYTYTLTYETNHQLKLLDNFDELAWNVNGTSWKFRIDSIKCTLILPKGATPLSSKCYTGKQNEKDEDCNFTTSTIGDSTVVVFKSTKPFMPEHGLTVATSWKKGFITANGSAWSKLKYIVWNNKAVFLLPLGALFSVLFGFIAWLLYGRDPKRGVVYPLFEPPAGYSPAAMGYIYDQKYSGQLTAATIVDAAVRNNIKIDVQREGKIFKHNEYKILMGEKKNKAPISNYNDFWSDVKDLVDTTIEKGKYNSSLGDLQKTIKEYCETNYKSDSKKKKRGFFKLNNSYMTIPSLVCTVMLIWGIIEVMRSVILKNYWQIGYFALGIILCLIVFRIFGKLLPAYTSEGRKLMDSIQGFRMFLATADEKRFDTMNPPKKSLELYEKYLPFAIALDCEIAWGNKFEAIIDTASVGGTVAASSFSNSHFTRDSSFSSSFTSSFSGAISSASSPPGSSSGGGSSFGGGSSGGGGGGGGGGGW